MKASELRIGNYVSSGKYNTVEEIIGIEPIKLFTTSGYSSIGEYEPIPLTDEWLEKFGFKESEYAKKTLLCDVGGFNSRLHIDINQDDICVSVEQVIANDVIYLHCEYVHQLQNLYFSLTGEELILINKT